LVGDLVAIEYVLCVREE
jgi:hypothetical protein